MNIIRIDKMEQTEAIKERYGENYFKDNKAIADVCELWGVEMDLEGRLTSKSETLVEVGRCWAEMSYIETTNGQILLGLTAMFSANGFASPADIWNGKAFASLMDARVYAMESSILFFNQSIEFENSCSSQQNNQSAIKAVQILQNQLTPQLELF